MSEKKWGLDYYDGVENSQIVLEFLDDLVYYKTLENIAFDFVEEMRISTVPQKSAWYLELSVFDNEYSSIRSERFKKMISDKKYLEQCAQIVKGSSLINATLSPTYWRDVFKRLGIAS